jgi:hypothetical protein
MTPPVAIAEGKDPPAKERPNFTSCLPAPPVGGGCSSPPSGLFFSFFYYNIQNEKEHQWEGDVRLHVPLDQNDHERIMKICK